LRFLIKALIQLRPFIRSNY